MKFRLLFTLLFCCLLNIAFSQNNEIEALAKRITYGIENDSLKVVAICKWLMDNIEYDWDNYKREDKTDDCILPIRILTHKKAICAGYSNFFHELCTFNNIQSEKISGFALGISVEDPKKLKNIDDSNHAWNAVKINEKWFLMDVTWADDDKNPYQYDMEYLWGDPSVFIKKHLPEDPLWQLLDNPISVKCFLYGENCGDTLNQKTNFGKLINKELRLDSLTRCYNYYKRSMMFNSENIDVISSTLYFFQDRGVQTLGSYYSLKTQKKLSISSGYSKDSILAILKKAKKYFEMSFNFSAKIYHQNGTIKGSPVFYDYNLKEIEKEIILVEQLYK